MPISPLEVATKTYSLTGWKLFLWGVAAATVCSIVNLIWERYSK